MYALLTRFLVEERYIIIFEKFLEYDGDDIVR